MTNTQFNQLQHSLDSIRIEKIDKRIGRTVCQCYYWNTRKIKIDSIGLEQSMTTCIPYEIVREIRTEYYKEYNNPPFYLNFVSVLNSKKRKNHGLSIGLYYFYLGYTSHPTLFKVLVFEDKAYLRLKREDKEVKLYKDVLNDFDNRYSSYFSRKHIQEIGDDFMFGLVDVGGR